MKKFPNPTLKIAVAARTALALLAWAAIATPASARPDTRTMTCDYAQAFVKSSGSVVMSTGQYTYERFVYGRGLCGPREHTRLLTAPTLDNPRCRVGNICEADID